jgi:hypothetical protein
MTTAGRQWHRTMTFRCAARNRTLRLYGADKSMIAELRRWGEDQAKLIASQQLAPAEQSGLLARPGPVPALERRARRLLCAPQRGWRRLAAVMARKHHT